MRVLVCGGRDFRNREWLWDGLDLLHGRTPITEIIEGGATGADTLACSWARLRLRPDQLTTMPADWDKHGKSAGYIRNSEMAKLKPDLVLAAPGGKGTANMIAVAKAHKIGVILLDRLPVKRKGGPEGPPPAADGVILDA